MTKRSEEKSLFRVCCDESCVKPMNVLAVLKERARQETRWGEQNHGQEKWLQILIEEVGEYTQACLDGDMNHAKEEMVQVAAVALAIIESMDRNELKTP